MAGSRFPSRRSPNRRPGERTDARADAEPIVREETIARRPVAQNAAALFATMEAELQREKAERSSDADRMGEMLMRVAMVETELRQTETKLAAATTRSRELIAERDRALEEAQKRARESSDVLARAARAESAASLAAVRLEVHESLEADASRLTAELENERKRFAALQRDHEQRLRELADSHAVARQTDALAVADALQRTEEAKALAVETELRVADALASRDAAEAAQRLAEGALRETREALAYTESQTHAAFAKAEDAKREIRESLEAAAREAALQADETLRRVRAEAAARALADSRHVDELIEAERAAKAELTRLAADAEASARQSQADLRAASAAAAEAHTAVVVRERELAACRQFLKDLVVQEQANAVVRIDSIERAIAAMGLPRGPAQGVDSRGRSEPPERVEVLERSVTIAPAAGSKELLEVLAAGPETMHPTRLDRDLRRSDVLELPEIPAFSRPPGSSALDELEFADERPSSRAPRANRPKSDRTPLPTGRGSRRPTTPTDS